MALKAESEKKSSNIVLMISTMNYQKPLCLDGYVGNFVIINQILEKKLNPSDNIVNEHEFNFFEKGLSKSRNRGLDLTKNFEICCVADNDILYVEDYESVINNYFNIYKDADVLTFGHILNGKLKINKNKIFKHNLLSIMKVSSIEIVFKRDSIVEKNIKFDERFGLGSFYSAGEENIFLSDCLKNKLNVYSINVPISIHPDLGVGSVLNEKYFFTRGAVFYRIYSFFSLFIGLIFVFRKSYNIKDFFKYYLCFLKGIYHYEKK